MTEEPSRAELKYLVERQREEIITINAVGKLLVSSTNPTELWQLIASYLKETFPVAVAVLVIPKQRMLNLIRFANSTDADLTALLPELEALSAQQHRLTWSLNSLTPTIHNGHADDSWRSQAPLRQLRSRHTMAITHHDEPMGLLALYSGKPEAFSPDERHTLDIIADQFSAALHNAFLFEELKQANAFKQDLLMVISHELRTPLTAIKEGVNLLGEGTLGPVTEDQREFLNTVDNNVGRLTTLVERATLASQLVANRVSFKTQDLLVGTVLKKLAEQFEPLAIAKKVQFSSSLPPEPLMFQADPERMQQALGQLLENAVHATPPERSVQLSARKVNATLEIAVSDAGPGIPPDQLKEMFLPFQMVGNVDNRKTGGLGLGLFIAYQLITRQGGELTVSSELGHGSTFTARFGA
jgi:signal transduction histidine kinase